MRFQEQEKLLNDNFLWFDLGDKDPYYILPIVAGITTFIQQKMMMAGTQIRIRKWR